ncbi:TRAP transporter large permease [Fusibacter paucivorans]|uniref:TRAP transporter large permease n=1 Tax=Fusibacter paucivorans TaxID=76009 RepID=A0ABS5PMP4_9FIRM|nr:TRAP transporter large permease [Fusibacter paucivorans]MBS7526448.1 TRAP transporter large permease [Fusibacter paucivorans]
MSIGLIFLLLFVLLFLGVPIGISIGIPICLLVWQTQITTFEFIAQFMYTKPSEFTLLALPFFIVAGDIMDTGGLSKRLVGVANNLIGNVTGGLGIVAILGCMFFGAVSGSSPATVAAIGTIMIPQMVRAGYDKYYATGLIAVAGGLGIIVPPSFPLVLYGVTNDVSISDLFLAGFGPALVVGIVLVSINFIYSKRYGYKEEGKTVHFKELLKSIWDAKWALLMPVIILGGIYSGACSPTEAAVISCVYGLFIGVFVYKELDVRNIVPMFKNKVDFIGGVIFTFAPAGAMGAIFAYLGYTTVVKNFFLGISTNPYVIVLLMYALLFVVGMFVQTMPAIVILSPILLGVAEAVGIDPVHFGLIVTLALAVAFVTPPVALNLFVASSMTGLSMERITRAAMPFIAGLLAAEIIVGFNPILTTGIIDFFGK